MGISPLERKADLLSVQLLSWDSTGPGGKARADGLLVQSRGSREMVLSLELLGERPRK